MRKIGVAVTTMMAMVLVMGTGSALADQHNQRSCEAAGGTWTSDRGSKECTFQETDTGKNEKFECTTTETSGGQGNLGNKSTGPDTTEEGTPTGSGKCPPGQHK